MLGEYQKAHDDIQQAVRLRPDYQEAIDVFNKTELRLREQASARSPQLSALTVRAVPSVPAPAVRAEKAQVSGGLSAIEHEKLGRQLTQEQKYPEAIAELSEAVRQKPGLATAFNARGYAYLRLHDTARAAADFNEALRLNPHYQNARQNLAASQRTH